MKIITIFTILITPRTSNYTNQTTGLTTGPKIETGFPKNGTVDFKSKLGLNIEDFIHVWP